MLKRSASVVGSDLSWGGTWAGMSYDCSQRRWVMEVFFDE